MVIGICSYVPLSHSHSLTLSLPHSPTIHFLTLSYLTQASSNHYHYLSLSLSLSLYYLSLCLSVFCICHLLASLTFPRLLSHHPLPHSHSSPTIHFLTLSYLTLASSNLSLFLSASLSLSVCVCEFVICSSPHFPTLLSHTINFLSHSLLSLPTLQILPPLSLCTSQNANKHVLFTKCAMFRDIFLPVILGCKPETFDFNHCNVSFCL